MLNFVKSKWYKVCAMLRVKKKDKDFTKSLCHYAWYISLVLSVC